MYKRLFLLTLVFSLYMASLGFGQTPAGESTLSIGDPSISASTGEVIKAWTEGDRSFRGATMVDGKVLLFVPNTVHFRYRETTTDDGSVVRTRVLAVDPDIELPKEFHPGVRVLHFDEAAIDPYEYLDLP